MEERQLQKDILLANPESECTEDTISDMLINVLYKRIINIDK
jgi:hypothetical protein